MRIFTLASALILSLFSYNVASAETHFSGVLTEDTTWHKADSPYVLDSYVVVPSGITLTIEPGVIVKMGQPACNCYSNIGINPNGKIIAGSSTSTERVIFTSIHDDIGGDTDATSTAPQAGDWRMILVTTNAILELHHVDVRYGGLSAYPYMYFNPDVTRMIDNSSGTVIMDDADISNAYVNASYRVNYDGTTTISNSRFHDTVLGIEVYHAGNTSITNTTFATTSVGIVTSGGLLNITDSIIAGNQYGIAHYGGETHIHNSIIKDNSILGVYNTTASIVDATNNWWGAVGGPTHTSNPLGTGDKVSDNVDYGNWLTADPNAPVTPSCEPNCYSNVLFLPGIEGSRLYDSTGNRRWLSADDTEADYIRMNSDGTSALPDITTKDAIDTADAQQLYTDIYKSFLAEMKTWEQDYDITATTTPYDWRLSYDNVVNKGRKLPNGQISYLVSPEAGHDPYLLETLKQLASTSKTHKVTIIGHSQGGLIAKALMQKIGPVATAELIDKVIFVATPQLGTPQAVATILHGTDAGIIGAISESKVRELALNFPSAYTLLPSENYFTYVDDSVIDIDQATLPDWASKYGTTTHSTVRLSNFLLDGTRTKPLVSDLATPEIANPQLFTDAQSAHISLDSWTPPAGVELITVAGWGEETLSGIKYIGVKKCIKKAQVIIQGRVNIYCAEYQTIPSLKPMKVIDGDGTVVEPSALWASGASITRYWVNLDEYNAKYRPTVLLPDLNHKNILEVFQLQELVSGIITGSSSKIDFITTVAPAAASTTPRLHFTLHSPLTLGFTDTLGNYTGSTATSTQFNIPSIRYERYGEVQWLSVPKELAGTIVMQGTASGSFTLDVEEVNGNDILATTSFEGIPSSTSTIVTMLINPESSPTASSTLIIDEDGNGTADITLQAQQNAVVLLPVPTDVTSPATVASTTGTCGTNNWFNSNVLVTLTATDTESGVASTSYSINGGAWTSYLNPFSITAEGSTTILYYSIDKEGNREATNTLSIKIDKTAPEAQIAVSTTTQDIVVVGTDNFGTTTVTKDASGNITLTDTAGHTTKLFFTKTYSGKLLTYAKLTGVQYDNQPKITLPASSFLYLWDNKTPTTLLSQTIAVDNTYLIQASYDKSKNKTTIIVLKKNFPIQTQVFTGLKIVKLTTNKGVVGYSW